MPTSIDLRTLFAQLQQRYPHASLTTELVQIHQDRFIVRALIQTAGMPLVSGMATANSVEAAEDEARLRALKLLGISTSDAATMPLPLQAQLLTSPLDNGSVLSSLPALSTSEISTATPISPILSFADLETSEALAETPPLMPPTSPVKIDEEVQPTPATRSTSKKSARSPSPPPDPEPEAIDEPTDLSELIALSDVEMQRIGWKRKDGQVHLLETYGVKTRAELDEEQLLEFLHFLRAVPSNYNVL
jgi:hypothetical protein